MESRSRERGNNDYGQNTDDGEATEACFNGAALGWARGWGFRTEDAESTESFNGAVFK